MRLSNGQDGVGGDSPDYFILRGILARSDVPDTLKFLPAAFECFPCFLDMIRVDSVSPPSSRSSEGTIDKTASELGVQLDGGLRHGDRKSLPLN